MIIRTELLKQAVDRLKSNLPTKTTLAIYNSALITSADEVARITTTNGVSWAWCDISCVSKDAEEYCIPFESLQALSRVKDDYCEITKGKKAVQLKEHTGTFRANTLSYDPGDFPASPESPAEFSQVATEPFMRALKVASTATSNDPLRPILESVSVRVIEGIEGSVLCATDTICAAFCVLPPEAGEPPAGICIPSRVARKIPDDMSTLMIGANDNGVLFVTDSMFTITHPPYGGVFPKLERVIPADDGLICKVNTRLLKDAISLVQTFDPHAVKIVRMREIDGKLSIDCGHAESALEADIQDGFECALSASIVTQALGVSDSDDVVIHAMPDSNPCYIEWEDVKYVIAQANRAEELSDD